MDISVIVPVYNVENYIERCLRSLFEQTKTNGVEFILVNDCTPDGSMAVARRIIAEYPHLSVRIIEHPKNRHVAATRQTGIDAAIGEYTIQIDSDDWCEPTMLEDMYTKALEEDLDIVSCDYNERRGDVHQNTLGDDKVERIEKMLTGNIHGSLCMRLIKKELYTKNSIKIDLGVNILEDLLCVIQLYYFTDKISHIPYPYYQYMYNPTSIIRKWYTFTDEKQKAYDFLDSFFKRHNDDRFTKALRFSKIQCKYHLVSCLLTKDTYGCMKLFPDTDSYIFSCERLSITAKVLMYSASRGWNWAVVLINKTRRLYHKLRGKAL
ncbi:MAG: glycosyltransferase family 2 protein [Rikenellaceae bacterium]